MINKLPEWYWIKGLHDADIKNGNGQGLFYDERERNPIRNIFKLEIDSSHALLDNTIKAIEFYNYKIISDIKNPKGIWWQEDELEEENGKFILTIKGHKNEVFTIKFDNAKVIR